MNESLNEPKPKVAVAASKTAAKVLVVDDCKHIRSFVKLALETGGHKVEEAESGRSALVLCEKLRFDLVLLDMRMPGLSGAETLVQLKKIDATLPVVALSSEDPEFALGQSNEFCQFLSKPIERQALLDAVLSKMRKASLLL